MSHSNKFKVLMLSLEGEELKTWLEANKGKLRNQRIFYILRANLESGNVFKIGVSERGDTSAYGRLNDYYHFYDKSVPSNPCKGVKLHLVLGNTFNADVDNALSNVRKLETKMKAHFKSKVERGAERLKVPLSELFEYLKSQKVLDLEDVENPVRQTPRLASKNQGSQDAVARIVGHSYTREGVVKYTTEFMEAFAYDTSGKGKKKKMPNRKLTYTELIGMRHGKRLVDNYRKETGLTDDDDSDDDENLLLRHYRTTLL